MVMGLFNNDVNLYGVILCHAFYVGCDFKTAAITPPTVLNSMIAAFCEMWRLYSVEKYYLPLF